MAIETKQQVFDELLGKYEGAEQIRNAQFGGMYRENNQAAHQGVLSYKKQYADAVTASDATKMQAVFDDVLKHFEGADHMRNFAASRMYIQDEKITKQTVKAFQTRYTNAS
jgi:hypothetical protein